MAFVEHDQIEEVGRKLCKPGVFGSLELMNIRHHDVSHFEIGDVGRRASDFCGLWERRGVQHFALKVEELRVARCQILQQLVGDLEVRCDQQCAVRLCGERRESQEA